LGCNKSYCNLALFPIVDSDLEFALDASQQTLIWVGLLIVSPDAADVEHFEECPHPPWGIELGVVLETQFGGDGNCVGSTLKRVDMRLHRGAVRGTDDQPCLANVGRSHPRLRDISCKSSRD